MLCIIIVLLLLLPICIGFQYVAVNCGRPDVPPHVSIGNAQDFTFGQTVTYMCTDRTLSPSPYSTVTCESTKLWSAPAPPQCVVAGKQNRRAYLHTKSTVIIVFLNTVGCCSVSFTQF